MSYAWWFDYTHHHPERVEGWKMRLGAVVSWTLLISAAMLGTALWLGKKLLHI
ncbi:MAG: hypothetical protein Q8Q41_00740 [bacterium]|nr:hypothetical protein [bacterium]